MNIHFHPTFTPVTITTDTLPHPGLENNSFILRWAKEHPDRVRALCAEMGISVAAVSANTRAPNGKRACFDGRPLSKEAAVAQLEETLAFVQSQLAPKSRGLPPATSEPNLPPAVDNGPRVNDI